MESFVEDYNNAKVTFNKDGAKEVHFEGLKVRRGSESLESSQSVSQDPMSVSEECGGGRIWWEALKGTCCKVGSDIKSLFSPITNIFTSSKKEVEDPEEAEDLLADVADDDKDTEMDVLGATQEDGAVSVEGG